MKRLAPALLCFCLVSSTTPAADNDSLRGYSNDSSRTERDWETRFRAIPDPANLRAYMQRLSARPHHVGSPYDKDNAEWILSKFKEWGLDARIETFNVLFPTPKVRAVELLEPTKFTAKLAEPTVAVDPTSAQHDEQLPVYNAYSIDGDVTAPLVYVNFGIPEDYEMLDRLGISVKGAIVIARYGQSWRGIKPKVAAEHGAIGCLIYSDPHEDGYAMGDVYPDGPFRPKEGAQRGSVMDMPLYPGDPLTPGVGATTDAKRLALSDAKTITRIPVLPISYGDAEPLLAALKGRIAPAAWRGSLPITYHVGPGPAKVHLKAQFNWDTKTIYDVVARIPGATYPDEWIIRGNHHDAWVNGAEDPVSGAVALMEEARGLGALLKNGWKPKRTIIYCVWDGEEEGLLGSTEWAETHAEELRRNGAVYLNSDGNSRGYLRVEGSHTLEKFINGVARDIDDPESHLTVWRRMQLREISTQGAEARGHADVRIAALGSGSDYTAFLDFLGVASVNLGFGGEDEGGIYHSVYDDFYWYTHFADTDFVYGRALAQTAGTSVMRLADSDLLPYDFDNFTDTIRRYIEEVQKLAKDKREQIIERNKRDRRGIVRRHVMDPRKPHDSRRPRKPCRHSSISRRSITGWPRCSGRRSCTTRRWPQATENGGAALARAALKDVNDKLIQVERALTLNEGLPNRPWFKNQIYAPGFYTGYGVKTLPAVRESIEQKDWKLADEEIGKVGKVLENTGEAIQGATTELSKAMK